MLIVAMLFDLCLVGFLLFWVFPKILKWVVVNLKQRSRDINAALEAEPEEQPK